ncbi:MAG: SLC13 family permease [Opitutaceae bacterium]
MKPAPPARDLPHAPGGLPRSGWILASGVLASAAGWALERYAGAPREAALMGGIFVGIAGLWAAEALPLFATALLAIGLQVVLLANPAGWPGLGFTGAAGPSVREVLAPAADPILLLFLGGLVLTRAAAREGVDRALAGWLLRPFGTRPRQALLGVMLVTLTASMWMSNTATTAMMLAIVAPMLAAMPPAEPFRKALLLGVPLAANLGGMATPIGSPPNALASSHLQQAGLVVGFLPWMAVAVPLAVGLAALTWLLLVRWHAPADPALRLISARAPLTRRGGVVATIFAVTAGLWITEGWHGLPAPVVALVPLLTLPALGFFTREDLAQLDWSVLILITGGLALGAGLARTGLGQLAAGWLPAGETGDGWALLTAAVLATVVLGTFISNTAAASLVLPVAASASAEFGPASDLSVVHLALSVALSASVSMALPMSTPPNAMAYAQNGFTTRELARVALVVSALAVGLILGGGRWMLQLWAIVP